jgi:hypothetical protein
MTENEALIARVDRLLDDVQFFAYRFEVREGHGGVFVQGLYEDSDIYTGAVERQHTRKWLLSPAMTDSEVVQTAFKLCMTSYEHRCREGFKYQGRRIFGPHFNVADLVALCDVGGEDAGGARATGEALMLLCAEELAWIRRPTVRGGRVAVVRLAEGADATKVKYRATKARWRAKNRDAVNAANRASYARNRAVRIAAAKAWREKNQARDRLLTRLRMRRRRAKLDTD